MAKLHHSFTQQKKILMPEEDNCPICEESLYLNNEYTQRVGLLNEDNQCCGWACPHCESTFDETSNITGVMGMDIEGDA